MADEADEADQGDRFITTGSQPVDADPFPLLRALVVRARELVAGGWCVGTFARDGAGQSCGPWSPRAKSYCLTGAILRAHGDARRGLLPIDPEQRQIAAQHTSAEFLDALHPLFSLEVSLAAINDAPNQTHGNLLATIDRALTLMDATYGRKESDQAIREVLPDGPGGDQPAVSEKPSVRPCPAR